MESRLARSITGRALVLAVTVASLVGSIGCATIQRNEARETENLLLEAGFQPRPADTPEKAAQLKSLPALKMEVRLKDGHPVYTYADPDNCNCLYIGGPKQYENYSHLISQQQVAEKQAAVVQAEEGEAMTFGTWGGW